MTRKIVGLALGGGAARGLVHIPVVEALDDLGIRPDYIAGTSVGSIVGAAYASGMSGKDIRALVERVMPQKDEAWHELLKKKDMFKWFGSLVPDWGRGGLLRADKLLENIFDAIPARRFEDLEIPLKVVATDYWSGEEVIFNTGYLHTAIRASISVSGIFRPVRHNGRVLIDGGAVNQVPYDLLKDCCDFIIAVNISGKRVPQGSDIPGLADCVLNTFDIMQDALVAEKIKHDPPDIYVRPEIENVRLTDFDKADDIYEQAMPAIEGMRAELEPLIPFLQGKEPPKKHLLRWRGKKDVQA